MDVIVDGGIRRGTDVVKALALGAKAVGIGRAALYGLAAGGQQGVERTLQSRFITNAEHMYTELIITDLYSPRRRNSHCYETSRCSTY